MLFAEVIVIFFFCLHCLFLYRTFECEMKIKVWYIHNLKSCFYMTHRVKWVVQHKSLLSLLGGNRIMPAPPPPPQFLQVWHAVSQTPAFGITGLIVISTRTFIISKEKRRRGKTGTLRCGSAAGPRVLRK